MSVRREYALIDSEFNAFLFAPVGEEANGMQLSVLSAFTRLGLDPWQEAARLSGLSRPNAVQSLTGILARLSELRAPSDIGAISGRLTALLPKLSSKPVAAARAAGLVPKPMLFWAAGLLAGIALAAMWILN